MEGIESIAPGRDTAIEEALVAVLILSSGPFPIHLSEMKNPINVSPAPIVSSVFTFTDGTLKIGFSKFLLSRT